MSATPRIRAVQSLWAMEDLPLGQQEWDLVTQIRALEDAGYDAVAVDMGARKAPAAADLATALADSPLARVVFTFAGSDAEIDAALDVAETIGATEAVLCARTYTQDVAEGADLISGWHARAAARGVELQLETHRNTLTNDLRFTRRLVDELDPAVGLAIDLSHYIVGAEIPAEPGEEIEAQVAGILARAASVQGRIASRCQVQLPLYFPSTAEWSALARRWWRQAFASILSRTPDAEHVTFVTELGTTPYALTDAAGAELSDRWQEAQTLRAWAADELAAAHAAVSSR